MRLSCSNKTKYFLLAFLLVCGLTGALVGIIGVDEIRTWFGEANSNTDSSIVSSGSSSGSSGGSSGISAISGISDSTTSTDNSDSGDNDSGGYSDTGGGDDIVISSLDTTDDIYSSSIASAGGDDYDPLACNGLQSNCDMKVNDLLWASVHNANHHRWPIPNQNERMERALDNGYRAFMFDVCECGEEIVFCHGSCRVGRRDPAVVFDYINDFLNDHPKEVLVINFELSDGGGDIPTARQLWDIFPNNGLKQKTYNYDGGSWPTLREMLDADRQLLLFKHNGEECRTGNTNDAACVNKIQEFHEFAVETQYALQSVDVVEKDTQFSCSGHRGSSGGTEEWYAINNFVPNDLGSPNKDASENMNSEEFLVERLRACEDVEGLVPNIINVDFWDLGAVVKVVRDINEERGLN